MTSLNERFHNGEFGLAVSHFNRNMLLYGELSRLYHAGVRGAVCDAGTTARAIQSTEAYQDTLVDISGIGSTTAIASGKLMLDDLISVADFFRSHSAENGSLRDAGWVVLAPGTVYSEEAEYLTTWSHWWRRLGRDNVFLDISVAHAGASLISRLAELGINLHCSDIFSGKDARVALESYWNGLRKWRRANNRGHEPRVILAISVNQWDVAMAQNQLPPRLGETTSFVGLAQASKIADVVEKTLEDICSQKDEKEKAKKDSSDNVLVSWAGLEPVDPMLPEMWYAAQVPIISGITCLTLPPVLCSRIINGRALMPSSSKSFTVGKADEYLGKLSKTGIDWRHIEEILRNESRQIRFESWKELQRAMAARGKATIPQSKVEDILNTDKVRMALERLEEGEVLARLWGGDYQLWSDSPAEIANRLGWLQSPAVMQYQWGVLERFASEICEAGFTHAVLLGMGGSSLAAEVFQAVFGETAGYLRLRVLDSTDPGAIAKVEQAIPLEHTLFIVSTKSGGTVETLSLFKHFYNRLLDEITMNAGEHFIAITDPGSNLQTLAGSLEFRRVFLNDPNIGGRYSVFSYFGLVPAALMGLRLHRLLEGAQAMAQACAASTPCQGGQNQGALLGAFFAAMLQENRDKLTLIADPALNPFGAWVEQLIAESTGKEGKGLLPVTTEPVGEVEEYREDRFFVYLKMKNQANHDKVVSKLIAKGFPVFIRELSDVYDLGAEFFLWEVATAVVSHFMSINPFDQPNVESAKVQAKKVISDYQAKGDLDFPKVNFSEQQIKIISSIPGQSLDQLLKNLLEKASDDRLPKPYIALQAYLTPEPHFDELFMHFSTVLRSLTGCAVTFGYGPRFLHSTGQLHKGDAGNGLFLQFIADAEQDLPIPDEPRCDASILSFGVLKNAQALGDRQALLDNHREVITFLLGSTDGAENKLATLLQMLKKLRS